MIALDAKNQVAASLKDSLRVINEEEAYDLSRVNADRIKHNQKPLSYLEDEGSRYDDLRMCINKALKEIQG